MSAATRRFRPFVVDPSDTDGGDAPWFRNPWVALFGFSLLLLVFLLWADDFDVVHQAIFQFSRRDAADPVLRGALTAGAYGLGTLGIAVLLCHASALVRRIAFLLVFIGVATVMGWRGVNGSGFSLHEATLFWTETTYAPDALAFFFARYAPGVAGAAAGVGLLAVLARRAAPRTRGWWPCALLLLALFVCRYVHTVSVAKVEEFPAPYRVALLLYYAYQHRVPYYGEREAPLLDPAGPPVADHVVFIVDESVSGDLLGINGGPAQTTPYLSSLGDRLLNFGVIPSIANVSAATNIVLQSGLRADELPDTNLRSLKNPNVFSYMERAGFDTFYIDAQTYGQPSNYLTHFDLDPLDGFLQILALEVGSREYEIDHRIVDHLVRVIESRERSFSYVLKAGAHIHYEGTYPESERVFRPTLRAGELSKLNFEGADRRRTMNSYLNALRWTVDAFWRSLVPELEATGRDVLLIYTSDHGQSLLEVSQSTGKPELLSHNRQVDPPVFQAMVPLFLVGVGEAPRAWLQARRDAVAVDRVTQFALFPTVLVAAGYDHEAVRARYGPDLFDAGAAPERRFFVSGDHFGRGRFQLNEYHAAVRPPAQVASEAAR